MKAAAAFANVVKEAQKITPGAKVRGFSTDVSNFNPYIADPRANYTEWSNSYDELHYAESLAPFLVNQSLPANFIIDQGRSGLQNQRAEWGDCPTWKTNSSLVDSIVWAKPAGESDGECGPLINGKGAPQAGVWWNDYAAQSVVNANPPLKPTWL
jgi:cellulose 1,4-beta-cellobiosidase